MTDHTPVWADVSEADPTPPADVDLIHPVTGDTWTVDGTTGIARVTKRVGGSTVVMAEINAARHEGVRHG